MKSSVSLAMLSASTLFLAFAGDGIVAAAQAQSAPVQTEQTPQQSDQSRQQDHSRAEDVRIGRDWKAQGGENDHAGHAAADEEHETIGRDWRAHPDNRDH